MGKDDPWRVERAAAGVGLRATPWIVAGLLALAPAPALAHEKWFTSPDSHAVDWSLVWSGRTLLAVAAVGAVVGLFGLLQRRLGEPAWPRLPFFHRMAHGAMTLLAVQTAITLIFVAVQPGLLAPNLMLPLSPGSLALAAVQIAVAFTFITGLFDRGGALGLGLLWLASLLLFGPIDALQQLLYPGIALVVLIVGRASLLVEQPLPPFDKASWGAHAVAGLRLLSGLSFLMLGFADKVWNPDLGQSFLADHPGFNLPRQLGFSWFTDERFIMAAGIVEASIGALLLAGFLTRVVILGMWLPFNLTVPFLPPVEMIGHLPIFGVMYVLLVYGSGSAASGAHLPTEAERAADEQAAESGPNADGVLSGGR